MTAAPIVENADDDAKYEAEQKIIEAVFGTNFPFDVSVTTQCEMHGH